MDTLWIMTYEHSGPSHFPIYIVDPVGFIRSLFAAWGLRRTCPGGALLLLNPTSSHGRRGILHYGCGEANW